MGQAAGADQGVGTVEGTALAALGRASPRCRLLWPKCMGRRSVIGQVGGRGTVPGMPATKTVQRLLQAGLQLPADLQSLWQEA